MEGKALELLYSLASYVASIGAKKWLPGRAGDCTMSIKSALLGLLQGRRLLRQPSQPLLEAQQWRKRPWSCSTAWLPTLQTMQRSRKTAAWTS